MKLRNGERDGFYSNKDDFIGVIVNPGRASQPSFQVH